MNLIRLNNIKKSFGGTLLFQDVSFDVGDSDKVAIIGKNGVGKSTLFKLILKEIAPDSGDIFIFGDTTIGYLSQEVLSGDSRTLMDEMLLVFQEVERLGDKLREITEKMAANPSDAFTNEYGRLEELYRFKGGYEYQTFIDMILSRFGFGKTDYDRQVGSFSGGEKTRIAFAKILLAKPDVLLLDEPTNHMDIEIIEWLEDYLKRYEGAVVVITHDKYFIDKVAREIYEFDNEHLEK
ncbi:MAG: ATP-binding cassette domain-containing protein [Candidatus Izemoplasmatales bacterium]|nr:ATP-binding cassette domain-containing protein [Candidatus Izemoplasmatales bacterium]